MRKIQDQNVILAIFLIVTIASWIGFDLYHISVTSTVDENLRQIIVPLNPKLDNTVIDKIKHSRNEKDFLVTEKKIVVASAGAEFPSPTSVATSVEATSSAQ